MQWVGAATWRRFAKAAGSRVLLLGPPNGGTWMPMQLLSGDDTLGNLLPSLARPFATAAVRQMFAGFPGLMQLQADLTALQRTLGEVGDVEGAGRARRAAAAVILARVAAAGRRQSSGASRRRRFSTRP